MYLVLCYDVSSDSRRQRLYKKLKAFMSPVQRSVFEGEVPTKRYAALLHLIHDTIDHQTDSVRIYQLSASGRDLTEHIGTAHVVDSRGEDIIL